MRKIDMLVIHVTDSPDSADKISVKQIREWHIQRGWSDIGYHWVINKNGWICAGRPEKIMGAHARGYNKHSIGMVWVGRNTCNVEQWTSLVSKGADLVEQYYIPVAGIVGHNEIPGVTKTCPNLNMTKYRNAVQQELNKRGQCYGQ